MNGSRRRRSPQPFSCHTGQHVLGDPNLSEGGFNWERSKEGVRRRDSSGGGTVNCPAPWSYIAGYVPPFMCATGR